MERSLDLFQRIEEDGLSVIENFVENRKIEELFLDFKRSSNNGSDSKLSNRDRNNLAKAISGFGNSEGGVLVWGVDCSKDADGADVAKALVLIENPQRFVSLLQGAVSGCTVPPHTGVENFIVKFNDTHGIVVTHIPKSNSAPHQMIPDRKYYIRAGSDFVPTPHDVLAGMFGRRPQPHVFHTYQLSKAAYNQESLHIAFGLILHNEGPGIASDIFSIVKTGSIPGSNSRIYYQTNFGDTWTGFMENEIQLSLITKPDVRLPPGANLQATVIHIYLQPPFEKKLLLTGSVGARGSIKYDFVIENSTTVLYEQHTRYMECVLNSGFGDGEEHDIVEKVLNL
ncbi:MAG: ATP-binding protein [Candidatus Thiodiazotropha endolucinida]|nr:ATP-binding protein [Candidatus Thiodiazotropha taylori]MCW4318755.1 ATP-binding protein [Candidatus Thiodiazotropha taylori]